MVTFPSFPLFFRTKQIKWYLYYFLWKKTAPWFTLPCLYSCWFFLPEILHLTSFTRQTPVRTHGQVTLGSLPVASSVCFPIAASTVGHSTYLIGPQLSLTCLSSQQNHKLQEPTNKERAWDVSQRTKSTTCYLQGFKNPLGLSEPQWF